MLKADDIERLESLNMWHWKNSGNAWVKMYNLLVHNTKNKVKSDQSLIAWISLQKSQYTEHKLSETKIALLESIENWKWMDDNAMDDTDISESDSDFEDNYKEEYNIKKIRYASKLKSQDRQKTENIGKDKWDTIYDKLELFVTQNGCMPSKDSGLFPWVLKQKISYRKSILSNERVRKLESLKSWDWDLRQKWQTSYDRIVDFVKQHGHFPKNNTKLGHWFSQQKSCYLHGSLTPERRAMLEVITDWSENKVGKAWRADYVAAKRLASKNGVPPSSLNTKIGTWVNIQKKLYHEGKLTPDKISLLDEINNWSWDGYLDTDDWGKMYQLLKSENYNMIMTSQKHPLLNDWINIQRNEYMNGKLDSEKISKLNIIKHWSWELDDESTKKRKVNTDAPFGDQNQEKKRKLNDDIVIFDEASSDTLVANLDT